MTDRGPASFAAGTEALFVPGADGLVPTDRARGPWSPDALHGGPVAALVARAGEDHPGNRADGLQLARMTLELLRPVPVLPLTVSTSVLKSGRKAQVLDLTVRAGGTEVAVARVLRLKRAGAGQALAPSGDEAPPPLPDDCPPRAPMFNRYPAFHNEGVEMRFVAGTGELPGPATVWIALACPVVAGEDPTAWQRAAAVADFGNGVSNELDFRTASFVNADLTVSLHRPPVGEWVCLDARTRFGTPGIGAAESALWDVRGRIGRAVQSLVVEAGG